MSPTNVRNVFIKAQSRNFVKKKALGIGKGEDDAYMLLSFTPAAKTCCSNPLRRVKHSLDLTQPRTDYTQSMVCCIPNSP